MVAQTNEESAIADLDTAKDSEKLIVDVFSPRFTKPKQFNWLKSLKVGEAADEAARTFGYEGGNPTLLDKDRHVLDRNKTLSEVGVQNFDKLELTDKGGGV